MAGMAKGPLCSHPAFSPLLAALPLSSHCHWSLPWSIPVMISFLPQRIPSVGMLPLIHKQFLIHWEGVVFGGRHKAEEQVTHLEGALLQMPVQPLQGGTGPGCSTNSKRSKKSSLVCHRSTGLGTGCSQYCSPGRTWHRSGLFWQMANRNISKGKSHPEGKPAPQGLQRGWHLYQVPGVWIAASKGLQSSICSVPQTLLLRILWLVALVYI